MKYTDLAGTLNSIRERINKELSRRNAPYGSVAHRNVTFSTPLGDFQVVDGEHVAKTANEITEITDFGEKRIIRDGKTTTLNNVEEAIDMLNKLEKEPMTGSDSSCRGMCTGLCVGTCYGQCSGCTNGCTGGCTSCSGGCGSGCQSGCGTGCTGGCGSGCQSGCGTGCTGGCNGCTS